MRVRRHVPFALLATALTLLLVGLARPMATVKTPRREGTVILAVDVSNSMLADDIKPTRLDAAKASARAFIQRQPPAVRIGVVAFGDGAVVVQPPTTVHEDVVKSIDRLSSGGGTSLGQGLVTALGAIAGKPVTIDPEALASDSAQVDIGYFGSATIVLLSDGEETSQPDPVSVAEVASVAGVRIHTIGIGTDQGTVVQINGFSVATALDSDLLEKVATTTDGTYHQADDAAGLAAISKTIDLRFKIVSQHTEVTGLFSAAAVVLLLAGALLSVLWFGRVV
jgi:Ca-activated chloride channel family protein